MLVLLAILLLFVLALSIIVRSHCRRAVFVAIVCPLYAFNLHS